jgi:exodeoxyribonuclease-3
VRIVTWNVNSLRARLPRVLELLELHRPDVVCIQETKCAPGGFPAVELAAAGYVSVDHSAGPWAGVALLARDDLALSDPAYGLAGEPSVSEARWCEATIEDVRFASVYVPNGRSPDNPEFPRKLAFLDAIGDRVGALRGSPLVVAGDMNVTPADADVYDPAAFVGSTHVTDDERSRLERILSLGMVDAYRHLHPDETQYTWWDYRAGNFHRGLGLRIDLALVSEDLAAELSACQIDRNFRKGSKPSDHAPLLVALGVPPGSWPSETRTRQV